MSLKPLLFVAFAAVGCSSRKDTVVVRGTGGSNTYGQLSTPKPHGWSDDGGNCFPYNAEFMLKTWNNPLSITSGSSFRARASMTRNVPVRLRSAAFCLAHST